MRIIRTAVGADLATALAGDPLVVLEAHGCRVIAVPELSETRGAGGWCDGMSFHRHGTLLYVPTDSKRQNFTVLHEFAHGLVQTDEDALDWLGEQDDPDQKLEQLCNEIASRLLLPDAVIDAVVGGGPLVAAHLTRLADTTAASQEVCAIALARRLPGAGMVLLTDRGRHVVVRAAVHGDLRFRPRPGDVVPDAHPLRRLPAGEQLRVRSFWAPPWGTEQETLYLDACASTHRTCAVLAVSDLWKIDVLHLSDPDDQVPDRPQAHRRCRCGFNGSVAGYPCPRCSQPFCPRCGDCECARRDGRLVLCQGDGCYLRVAAHDIVNGLCSECR
ncbi:ImmA/IrrE family metallo-endopeptidase [Pseudonocardia saturnea]